MINDRRMKMLRAAVIEKQVNEDISMQPQVGEQGEMGTMQDVI